MADKNIRLIVENRADLEANMTAGKIAIEKDSNKRCVYTDDDGTLKDLATLGATGMFNSLIEPSLASSSIIAADANGKLIPANFSGITGIQSNQVSYTPVSTTINDDNVKEALDYLFKEPFSVELTVDPALAEKGSTVDDVDAAFTINNNELPDYITPLASQGGTGIQGTTSPFGYTGLGLTSDQTFNVYAFDEVLGETGVGTAELKFGLKVYRGRSAQPWSGINETIVEAASFGSTELKEDSVFSKVKEQYLQSGGGDYLYYAYPQAWGTLNYVVVNGLRSNWPLITVSITNPSGSVDTYNVYVSPYQINGTVSLAFS